MNSFFKATTNTIYLGRLALVFSVVLSVAVNAQPASRIISTDAGVTDVLIALGLGANLVGVDVTSKTPKSITVAKVGYHRTLSAEGLMSLNPSLIIGSDHMGPSEVISFIEKSAVILVRLPTAKNGDQLKTNIGAIGKSVGEEGKAGKLLVRVDSAIAALAEQQLSADTKVAFLLQMDGRSLRLAGNGTTGDDIIGLLGGENIAQHNAYQAVSPEALINLAPEVIIVAGRGASESLVKTLLNDNPLLTHTPAAVDGNIIEIEGRSIVAGISVSAIEAVAMLATKLN
jgi:iron complex transport system substrate-binding protein